MTLSVFATVSQDGNLSSQLSFREINLEGDTYYCSEPVLLEDGTQYIVCIQGNVQTSAYIVYERQSLKSLTFETNTYDENNNLIESIVEEKQIYSPMVSSTIMPLTIGERTESWWELGYYYNTNSAYEDNYWRLYNPLDEDDPSLFFFAAFETKLQEYAQDFAVCVNNMVAIQEAMDLKTGTQIPDILLSLGKPTLQEILIALAGAGADWAFLNADDVQELYNLRDEARQYYRDVKFLKEEGSSI